MNTEEHQEPDEYADDEDMEPMDIDHLFDDDPVQDEDSRPDEHRHDDEPDAGDGAGFVDASGYDAPAGADGDERLESDHGADHTEEYAPEDAAAADDAMAEERDTEWPGTGGPMTAQPPAMEQQARAPAEAADDPFTAPLSGLPMIDEGAPGDIDDVPVNLAFVLGKVRLPVGEVRRLAPGSVVLFKGGSPASVAIVSSGRTLGRGEIVDVDGQLGIRITQWSVPC